MFKTLMSYLSPLSVHFIFFFNDTATTQIYTLSLHDALPISPQPGTGAPFDLMVDDIDAAHRDYADKGLSPLPVRSEEHMSELQSRFDLVCRLLLEKKK